MSNILRTVSRTSVAQRRAHTQTHTLTLKVSVRYTTKKYLKLRFAQIVICVANEILYLQSVFVVVLVLVLLPVVINFVVVRLKKKRSKITRQKKMKIQSTAKQSEMPSKEKKEEKALRNFFGLFFVVFFFFYSLLTLLLVSAGSRYFSPILAQNNRKLNLCGGQLYWAGLRHFKILFFFFLSIEKTIA